MDDDEILEAILKNDFHTTVLIVSGDIRPEYYNRVMSMGAVAFLRKPIGKEAFTKFHRALNSTRHHQHYRKTRPKL
jgi:DNA-binding NarL/FixJ family response regulator